MFSCTSFAWKPDPRCCADVASQRTINKCIYFFLSIDLYDTFFVFLLWLKLKYQQSILPFPNLILPSVQVSGWRHLQLSFALFAQKSVAPSFAPRKHQWPRSDCQSFFPSTLKPDGFSIVSSVTNHTKSVNLSMMWPSQTRPRPHLHTC